MRRPGWTFAALIALWLLGAIIAHAYELQFEGRPPKNSEALRKAANTLHDSASLSDSLTQLLANAGYLEAEVAVSDDVVTVNAGPVARLHSIMVGGDSTYVIDVGSDFTESSVAEASDRLLLPWRSRGYWFATAHLNGLSLGADGRVNLQARLARGPIVTVSEIDLAGLKHTRPEVVVAYLPVKAGDTLTPDLISGIDRAAASSDLIRPSSPAKIVPLAGYQQAAIRLPVEEPRQFAIDGAVGIAGDEAESRDLLWSLRMQLNSLFGYGRRLALRTERPDRGRYDLTIRYRQPMFLLGPGWLTADLATRDYRDRFYEFSVGADVSTTVTRGIDLGFGLGWKTVTTDTDRPTFDRYDIAVTFDGYDVDSRMNPYSGWRSNWRMTFSYRRYHDDTVSTASEMAALEETRVELTLARFQPLLRPWLLHLGLHYDGLQTKEELPPLSELRLLGGPSSIRGYRSEQFAALQAAWGTIEPRLRYAWGYAAVFLDIAYLRNRFERNGDIATEEKFRYGYGIGLGLTQSSKGVSISLAWNRELSFDQPYLAVRFNSEW